MQFDRLAHLVKRVFGFHFCHHLWMLKCVFKMKPIVSWIIPGNHNKTSEGLPFKMTKDGFIVWCRLVSSAAVSGCDELWNKQIQTKCLFASFFVSIRFLNILTFWHFDTGFSESSWTYHSGFPQVLENNQPIFSLGKMTKMKKKIKKVIVF